MDEDRQRADGSTDADIVGRVLAGDRDQYARVVSRYQQAMYRHAVSMVLDHDAAADMVQDIVALLPPWVRATIVRTAGALGQPGAGAAAAFVAAVADHLGGLAAGAHEDRIRNAFSVAVARMLVR